LGAAGRSGELETVGSLTGVPSAANGAG